MVRVEVLPTSGDKGSVNAFQHRVGVLVAPSEQVTMQMNFLQRRLGEEAPKLAHESPVEKIVVFILRSVDHIEVAG
jgi:hypothetical protein